MGKTSHFLNSLLRLAPTVKDTFRADFIWKESTMRATFGGLLTTQALKAANNTVASQYDVHSLHCYYMKPGLVTDPIEYHVDRPRDGATIATRIVTAHQKGALVMHMMASFHKEEESDLSYQYPMPSVPHPEQLKSFDQLKEEHWDKLEEGQTVGLGGSGKTEILPFDIKPVHPEPMVHWKIAPWPDMTPQKPHQMFWIKMRELCDSADPRQYQYVASLESEWGPMFGAFYPHPTLKISLGTSLDHSVFFHRKFSADQWLLFDCDSPIFENARAYMTGRLWTTDGVLVVSFTQEALIRGSLTQKV